MPIRTLLQSLSLLAACAGACAHADPPAPRERYGMEIEMRTGPLGMALELYALPDDFVYTVWDELYWGPRKKDTTASAIGATLRRMTVELQDQVDRLPLRDPTFLRRLPADLQAELGVERLPRFEPLRPDAAAAPENRDVYREGLILPRGMVRDAGLFADIGERWRSLPFSRRMRAVRMSDLSPALRGKIYALMHDNANEHMPAGTRMEELRPRADLTPELGAFLARFAGSDELGDATVLEMRHRDDSPLHDETVLYRDIMRWADLLGVRRLMEDLPQAQLDLAARNLRARQGNPDHVDEVLPFSLHYHVSSSDPRLEKSDAFFISLNSFFLLSRIVQGNFSDFTAPARLSESRFTIVGSKGLIRRVDAGHVEIRAHVLPLREEIRFVAALMRADDLEARAMLNARLAELYARLDLFHLDVKRLGDGYAAKAFKEEMRLLLARPEEDLMRDFRLTRREVRRLRRRLAPDFEIKLRRVELAAQRGADARRTTNLAFELNLIRDFGPLIGGPAHMSPDDFALYGHRLLPLLTPRTLGQVVDGVLQDHDDGEYDSSREDGWHWFQLFAAGRKDVAEAAARLFASLSRASVDQVLETRRAQARQLWSELKPRRRQRIEKILRVRLGCEWRLLL